MIPPGTVSELGRYFEVIRSLDAATLERLRDAAQPLHLKHGLVAFDEGSACSAFVMLTEGCIKVAKPAPSGREILLYRVEPGQTCVLTLNCLLEEVEYPARGTVTQECFGALLPRPFFLQLIEQEPAIRQMVLRSLSARILELMALIQEVAFNRLDQRLAHLLAEHVRSASDPVLRCTHQQLADELGSVREIVSRILGSFSDDGLVRLERGSIQILDADGLDRVHSNV